MDGNDLEPRVDPRRSGSGAMRHSRASVVARRLARSPPWPLAVARTLGRRRRLHLARRAGRPLAAAERAWHDSPADLTPEQRAWLTRDERLRERAALLAKQRSRDVEDIYRTLRQLERTPAERLALGLRHGRLHPDRRRAEALR